MIDLGTLWKLSTNSQCIDPVDFNPRRGQPTYDFARISPKNWHETIGGSRGGVRDARPPLGVQDSFDFMQFSGKFGVFTPPLEGSRPPLGKNPGSATGNWQENMGPQGGGVHPSHPPLVSATDSITITYDNAPSNFNFFHPIAQLLPILLFGLCTNCSDSLFLLSFWPRWCCTTVRTTWFLAIKMGANLWHSGLGLASDEVSHVHLWLVGGEKWTETTNWHRQPHHQRTQRYSSPADNKHDERAFWSFRDAYQSRHRKGRCGQCRRKGRCGQSCWKQPQFAVINFWLLMSSSENKWWK